MHTCPQAALKDGTNEHRLAVVVRPAVHTCGDISIIHELLRDEEEVEYKESESGSESGAALSNEGRQAGAGGARAESEDEKARDDTVRRVPKLELGVLMGNAAVSMHMRMHADDTTRSAGVDAGLVTARDVSVNLETSRTEGSALVTAR